MNLSSPWEGVGSVSMTSTSAALICDTDFPGFNGNIKHASNIHNRHDRRLLNLEVRRVIWFHLHLRLAVTCCFSMTDTTACHQHIDHPVFPPLTLRHEWLFSAVTICSAVCLSAQTSLQQVHTSTALKRGRSRGHGRKKGKKNIATPHQKTTRERLRALKRWLNLTAFFFFFSSLFETLDFCFRFSEGTNEWRQEHRMKGAQFADTHTKLPFDVIVVNYSPNVYIVLFFSLFLWLILEGVQWESSQDNYNPQSLSH